jgi:hypothetical protein
VKVIVRFETLEMVIESPDISTRPTIKGSLWDTMKTTPIEDWLILYRQERFNRFEEIDFAIGIQRDSLMTVEWIEPIEGYESTDKYIV